MDVKWCSIIRCSQTSMSRECVYLQRPRLMVSNRVLSYVYRVLESMIVLLRLYSLALPPKLTRMALKCACALKRIDSKWCFKGVSPYGCLVNGDLCRIGVQSLPVSISSCHFCISRRSVDEVSFSSSLATTPLASRASSLRCAFESRFRRHTHRFPVSLGSLLSSAWI